MHDWTLISIFFEWKTGRAVLSFNTCEAGVVTITAEGVSDMHIPQLKKWAPVSVSINCFHHQGIQIDNAN